MVFRQRNSQRFSIMDISPTEMKRAASAQPVHGHSTLLPEPNTPEELARRRAAQMKRLLKLYR